MEPPEHLEHFQILRDEAGRLWELGRGAMGITYKAFDTRLRTTVALKVIRPEITQDSKVLERFRREAQAAASLHHPNIVGVRYFGEVNGLAFYVMEYCEGPTIYRLVTERGPLAVKEALTIALQVARALVVAEEHKILHRDLKPTNLILSTRADEILTVKVIDFGLACTYGEDRNEHDTTRREAFTGTVWFASPEQLLEQQLDIRSDFYALGACIWFMLSGKPVFGGTPAEVMAATLKEAPSLGQLPLLPIEVKSLLESLLAKTAASRPPSARALCADIEDCQAALAGPGRPRETRSKDVPPGSQFASSDSRPNRTIPAEKILQHFQLGTEVDTHPCWTTYRAVEAATGAPACAYILNATVAQVPSVIRDLEEGLCALAANPHKNIAAVLAFGQTERGWLIIAQDPGSATALQVLRIRGLLRPSEAVRILAPVASALDHLESNVPSRQAVSLSTIYLDFDGSPPKKTVLETPVTQWPPFTVRMLTLGLENLLSGEPMETVSSWNTVRPEDVRVRGSKVPTAAAQVATAFYELVGGNLARRGKFVTLPQLTEEANRLLTEAELGRAATAIQWFDALEASLGIEISVDDEVPVRTDKDKFGTGDETKKPGPGIQWQWVVAALVIVPVCLALGWLATTAWKNRSAQDPRAADKSISVLEDIIRRRAAMRSTLDEIETIQIPEIEKAKRLAEQSPGSGWEENVRILEQAVAKRKQTYRKDRAFVDQCQNTLLDAWEAYPDSYEDTLRGIHGDAPGRQNQEMADLAQDFIDRFGQLGKDPNREHGHDLFLDRVCQTQNNSEKR